MNTGPRDFCSTAVTLAGAAVSSQGAGQPHSGEHDPSDVPSDVALRVKSLESLLVENCVVDSTTLDALIDTFEKKAGPGNGAKDRTPMIRT